MSKLSETMLVKAPPLVSDTGLIRIKTIKPKHVDEIRGYNDEEYRALLNEKEDALTGRKIADEHSTLRIIGRLDYLVLFTFKRGDDPTVHFGKISGVNWCNYYSRNRIKEAGIEWPLDTDQKKQQVEAIEKKVWLELERLPQIFRP